MPGKTPAGPSPKARNTAARLAAVQTLYQMKVTGQGADPAIDEFLRHRMGKPIEDMEFVAPDTDLFINIVRQASTHAEAIDELIRGVQTKTGTPEPLLQAVLECGTAELLCFQEIDAPLIISDYLEVAHAFYDQGEHKLVNAILDQIAKRTRSG